LLVAEEKVNQGVIKNLLERMGLEAAVVDNGHEAVDRAAREPWSAVLLDLRLPGIGWPRGRPAHPALAGEPAAAAHCADGPRAGADRAACLDAGMNDFLAKPVNQAELWACLQRWIGAESPTNPSSLGAAKVAAVGGADLDQIAVLDKERR
jgi:CheY-like chemotaxis protein